MAVISQLKKRTKNLLNLPISTKTSADVTCNITENNVASFVGSTTSYPTFSYDVLDIPANTTVTVSFNTNDDRYVLFRLRNSTTNEYVDIRNSGRTVTPTFDVDRFQIAFNKNIDYTGFVISNIQVEQGIVATEYEPYYVDITKYNNELLTDIYHKKEVFEGLPLGDYHFAKNTESTGICDNAVEEPIIDLKVSGNSVQQTYTGKNLFNKANVVRAEGLNVEQIDNGFKVTQTQDSTYNNVYISLGDVSEHIGKTYVYLGKNSGTYISCIPYSAYGVATNATTIKRLSSGTGYYFTVPEEATGELFIRFLLQNTENPTGNTQTIENVQIELGTISTEYEPYVGGKASPNPDYPQEIESVGEKTKNIIISRGFSGSAIVNPNTEFSLSNSYGTTISTTEFANSLTVTQSKIGDTSNLANYINGYFAMQLENEEGDYTLSFDIDVLNNPLNATEIKMINQGGNTEVPSQTINLPTSGKGRVSFTLKYRYREDRPSYRYLEFRCMGMSFNISNIMLTELGQTTEYEPYGYKIPINVSGKNLFNKSSSPAYTNTNKVTIEETETGVKLINPAVENAVSAHYMKIYAIESVKNIGANTVYMNVNITLSGVPTINVTLGYCDENGGNRKTAKTLSVTENGNYTISMTIDTENYADKYLGLWLYSIATSETVTLENGSYVEYSNLMLSIGESDYEPYIEPKTTNIYLKEPLRKIGDYADYIDYKNKNVVRCVEVLDDSGTQTIGNSYQGLSTPTEETIDIPEISTSKGTNIFNIDTTIQPTELKINYWKQI